MTIVTFIDTETTGLETAKGHKIIEMAMISYELESAKEVSRYIQRFDPQRPIDMKASEVHGICTSDLKGCELFKYHEPAITKIIEQSDWLIAHNASFDIGFLVSEYMNAKKDLPDREVYDTMENGRFASFYGKCPTLWELCFACDIEFDDTKAHSAIYDTEKLAEAFFACHPRHFKLTAD